MESRWKLYHHKISSSTVLKPIYTIVNVIKTNWNRKIFYWQKPSNFPTNGQFRNVNVNENNLWIWLIQQFYHTMFSKLGSWTCLSFVCGLLVNKLGKFHLRSRPGWQVVTSCILEYYSSFAWWDSHQNTNYRLLICL